MASSLAPPSATDPFWGLLPSYLSLERPSPRQEIALGQGAVRAASVDILAFCHLGRGQQGAWGWIVYLAREGAVASFMRMSLSPAEGQDGWKDGRGPQKGTPKDGYNGLEWKKGKETMYCLCRKAEPGHLPAAVTPLSLQRCGEGVFLTTSSSSHVSVHTNTRMHHT
jgi:hypothetical protein